jgi:hypothetical protein
VGLGLLCMKSQLKSSSQIFRKYGMAQIIGNGSENLKLHPNINYKQIKLKE